MRKCLMILVVCMALSTGSSAVDTMSTQADMFGISTIPDELNDRAAQLMDPYDPAVQADFADGLIEIFDDAVSESSVHIKSTLSVMLRILVILIMCRFWCSLGENQVSRASRLVGALAVAACCMTDIHSMIGLGVNLIEEAFLGEAPTTAFFWKIVFTAITLGVGFKGGEIIPTLFIGATFGGAIALLLGLPIGTGAAIGIAVLFVCATKCPFATILLCCEMFGFYCLALIAPIVIISFVAARYKGLYSNNKDIINLIKNYKSN